MAVICHPNPSQDEKRLIDRQIVSSDAGETIQMKMHSSMRIQMESHTIPLPRLQENVMDCLNWIDSSE